MFEFGNASYTSVDPIGEKVLIKKMMNKDLETVGGIFIPETSKYKNSKIGVGKIVDIGDDAVEKYAVKKDDYVLYDYFSAYGDYKQFIITNAENILLVLSEDEVNAYLKNELKI